MALYVQHGHGKSDKITTALETETVDGVIFGARNEKLSNLDACIEELRGKCELLLDPQFYVCTLTPPKDGYLPKDYKAYYKPGRGAADFIGSKKNRDYAKATLDFQVEHGLDWLVSPSVIFDSFSDRWCQIALTLADASLEYHGGLRDAPPLLLSFIFHESALTSKEELDHFLDTITTWDVGGFYVIVVREDPSYSQRFHDGRLANLLYLAHVLGERNGYHLVYGYSDFIGVLLRAAGASAFATGWYQSLRQFHRNAFLHRKPGGRPPRERYSSGPLMNSVFLGELQLVHDVGELDRVLSGVPLDELLTDASSPEASTWNRARSEVQHWQTLSSLDGTLKGKAKSDIPGMLEHLREASGLYTELESMGVSFERHTNGDHLPEWMRAVRQFKELVRIR